MATQALVSSSSLTSSVDSARQILASRPLHSTPSRKVSFVVKAASTPPVKQGANRQLWFASKQSLSYLDGSLPGDFGFDPLDLSDPEGTGGFIEPKWLAYGEVINGRFAMLGAAGAIAPETLNSAGLCYFSLFDAQIDTSSPPHTAASFIAAVLGWVCDA